MKNILIILTVTGLALSAHAADFHAQINELIPKLGDSTVENRYDAQMQLQALAANASKPGNESDRAALATVLAGKATDASVSQPARVWIVRQLEYIGRSEAVAALTKLLTDSDAELRECARRALEENPDPNATDSLRAALSSGTGVSPASWRIGLIRSLGEKRDGESVKLIATSLNDAQAGGPAAKALGSIATREAIEALWRVIDSQPFAGEALIEAADRNPAEAAAIAQKLYAQSKSSKVRAAALSVLAKADPSGAAKLGAEALQGGDLRLQKAAVDITPAATLATLLPKLPAAAKVFALRALDASAEKVVIEAASDKDDTVRVAALEAMAGIGSADSVPALIKAAATGTDTEKTAAAAALGRINGRGAAEAIQNQAGQGDPAVRVAAIDALALRVARDSIPALLRYAGEADAAISKAALNAVRKIGSDEALDGIVKLVLAGKPGAKDALQTVANRSQNKAAVGQQLATQAQNASGQQLVAILDVMALVGGESALTAVARLTTSGNEEVKDGAIRALCNWREFAAVKPLLDVAGAVNVKQVHQVLAIQAVCRLVRSEETEPAQSRVDAALGALKVSQRDQERKQALSALASVKDRKAADAVIKLLADPTVQTDAGFAALTLADAVRKSDRGTAKKLAEAVKKVNISPDLTQRAEQSLKKR